jgi:iron complex outermembrane receptor protein
MKLRMKSMPVAILQVIASGAFSVATLTPAMAQQAGGEPAVQRVVVTGSLISRTDTETAAPVQVITAADIQRSGKTSIAELLQDMAANGAGTLGTGFSGAFANGASGVSLRGLTVGSTLVLIDGHRMSPYAIGDDSQRSFVDVSNIPFDAIDSIEVLKSGASSLYGSDAVAGVVNIKLKKNFNGSRFSADTGDTQHGGGQTNRASFSTGFGDLDTDGYNVFATAEWRKQAAIKVDQRSQYEWANLDWSGRGGNNLTFGVPTSRNNFLTHTSSPFLFNHTGVGLTGADGKVGLPGLNPANYVFLDPKCNFNLYQAGGCAVTDTYANIQPETENKNLLVGFTKKLPQDWELSVKGSIFQRDNENNRGLPQLYSATAFAGTNVNNNGVLTPGFGAIPNPRFPLGAMVGANVTSPFAQSRLYGYIPGLDGSQTQQNKATTTRLAFDLTGAAAGWELQLGGGLTKSKADIDYSGYVDRTALINLLRNGSWNVLGGNSQALLNQVSPSFSNTLESKLNYIDLVGSRDLTQQLGAGPLKLAVGLHWHKREWDAPPSPLTLNGQVGSTSAFVFGEETNKAIFAEIAAVPVKNVEFNLSSRYDHFDNNNSFTPSATLKWNASRQFALRGTFARGFRAPNPAETGNSGSFFLYHGIDDPVLCADGNKATPGNVPSACDMQPTYVQRPNKDLAPEKSKSFTIGAVLEPFKGLNATVDYYNIEVRNQIVTAAGNDPTYVETFVRGPAVPLDIATPGGGTAVGTPSVGPILFAESAYINGGSTKTSGIEADIGYRWNLGDKGVFRANLSAAHTISYEQTVAGITYQLAGTQGPSVVSGATGSPKNRAQLSLGWAKGPLDVNTTFNYTGDFSALDPSVGATDCASASSVITGRGYFDAGKTQPYVYCRVQSFTSTNLNVQYKVSSNLTLKASVLNLFDRQPPFDLSTYGNATAQTSYNASLHQAGAVGRFFSMGLAYTF